MAHNRPQTLASPDVRFGSKADFLQTCHENKNPGFACRGIWHFQMPRGRQFEYAPEKLGKS